MLGSEVKRLRKLKGLSQVELAELCGVTQSYITQLETDRTKFRSSNPLANKFAEVLGVPLSHWSAFTSDGHIAEQQVISMKCLGIVSAGGGEGADEDFDEPVMLEFPATLTRRTDAFALKIKGNSCHGFNLRDGDYIIVEPASEPVERGFLVMVTPDGRVVKRYSEGYLISATKGELPRAWKPSEEHRIIGIVVATISKPQIIDLFERLEDEEPAKKPRGKGKKK